MVDMWRALAPHMRGLPIEAMGGWAEVRVLGPSPGRVLVDPRMRHAMAGVVMWRPHFSWEVALWVIEAVWVGGPLEGMPWREVVLHEARRKAVEAVGVRRLAELRVLLVRWEGASEGRWPLHAEGRLTLPGAPGWLLMLAIPGALELAVPVGVWLVVPGCVTLAIPAGVTALLGPHALVAVVPGWAVGWAALVVWVRWLLGRLLLAPRGDRVWLVKPRGLARWDLVMGPRAPRPGGGGVLYTP